MRAICCCLFYKLRYDNCFGVEQDVGNLYYQEDYRHGGKTNSDYQ